jgi:glycosyltransferase involved in cell wall biosynthesis
MPNPILVSENIKVSIGVTTYDRFDMLVETINSIINQTYKNLEIIVSNDNPQRILTLSDFGLEHDSRIRIVNHSKNLGELTNLNWLMDNASGQYFTWLCDDDIIHPQHIEILAKELTLRKDLSCTFSGYTSDELLFEKLKSTNLQFSKFFAFDSESFILKYSRREIEIIGCYGLFVRQSLLATGGFVRLSDDFSPYSDTLIPIMLTRFGLISITKSPSVYFRAHSGSISNSFTEVREFLNAELNFVQILSGIILRNFQSWFRNNHLTVISRGGNLGLGSLCLVWLHACIQSQRTFKNTRIKTKTGFLAGIFYLIKHHIKARIEF